MAFLIQECHKLNMVLNSQRRNAIIPMIFSKYNKKTKKNKQEPESQICDSSGQGPGSQELPGPWVLQGSGSQGISDQGNPDSLVPDPGPEIWLSGSCLVCLFS